MTIYTDRTRIEKFEKCPALRFWGHEYEGKGLELVSDLALDARIGTWCHGGIEEGMQLGMEGHVIDVAEKAALNFLCECKEATPGEVSVQTQWDIVEGSWIVTALVYAWMKTKRARLLAEGDVLAIEKELTVEIGEGVTLMARPDIIWRRRSDGGVFIRNLKTVRDPERFAWREKWPLDMQTLSEPLAVDYWLEQRHEEEVSMLDNETYNKMEGRVGQPESCAGVIIDGLVTGRMSKNKETGLYYHDNPLIYGWYQGETDAFHSRFEWSCSGPHKFANGRNCEGGRSHRLSGAKRVAIAERYPGGIIAWVDHLIANEPEVVEAQLIELPPILRSEWQIERWRSMVVPREVAIREAAEEVEREPEKRDTLFPMHTASANCLMPGKCMCYDLCWGVAHTDPMGSGLYRWRNPNHPQEAADVNMDKNEKCESNKTKGD